MKSNLDMFQHLLKNADPKTMAPNSVINHHVDGVSYLCLYRSPEVTFKIYSIDTANITNENSGYLVMPHTHRYNFHTTVLNGEIEHIRFEKNTRRGINKWSEYFFDPSKNGHEKMFDHGPHQICMDSKAEEYVRGETYYVNFNEIHTLRIPRSYSYLSKQIVLGLIQFKRERAHSNIYLPQSMPPSCLKLPNSRHPTESEYHKNQNSILKILQIAY